MYILTKYTDIPVNSGDTIIEKERIDSFLQDCILGILEPDKVVIDSDKKNEIKFLTDNDINIVLTETYIEMTKSIPKEEDLIIQKDEPELIPHTETTNHFCNLKSEEQVYIKEPQQVEIKIKQTEKKKGFLSKIFSRKKNEDDSLVLNIVTPNTNIKGKAITQGLRVKQLLLNKNLMSKENITFIEKEMDRYQSLGLSMKFLQCSRINNMLSEDSVAEVLSEVLCTEIISKNKFNKFELIELNKDIINRLTNCFIYSIDETNKAVKVCKDYSDEVNLSSLEIKFIGYKFSFVNVIEGVTKEMLRELRGE